MNSAKAFWEKPLLSLDRGEWEALCDGCGRCLATEDDETGELFQSTSPASCSIAVPPNALIMLIAKAGPLSSLIEQLDELNGASRPVPIASAEGVTS
jgi:hypothetical protein